MGLSSVYIRSRDVQSFFAQRLLSSRKQFSASFTLKQSKLFETCAKRKLSFCFVSKTQTKIRDGKQKVKQTNSAIAKLNLNAKYNRPLLIDTYKRSLLIIKTIKGFLASLDKTDFLFLFRYFDEQREEKSLY